MPDIGKTLIAAITLLSSYDIAAADPIVILRDDRRVSASGFIQGAFSSTTLSASGLTCLSRSLEKRPKVTR